MKLLTFVVPCYNAEEYMRKCVQSLLVGKDLVEIILVNDGSTDQTALIADEYAAQYPSIVQVIHQENKGHGGAINTGIAAAIGTYFKVVDSDDGVDEIALKKVIKLLKDLQTQQQELDLIVANYVYEKVSASKKKVIQYAGMLPQEIPFTWGNIERVKHGSYLLMHALIYRTALLRQCGLTLPEHCFYVDNLFAYVPMIHVKRLYYINVNLYRYYIGRADQSVNEQVMIQRIDQQLQVNKQMVDLVDIPNIKNSKLRAYLYSYLGVVTGVSSIFLILSGNNDAIRKKKALWKYIKHHNSTIYKKISKSPSGIVCRLPVALHVIPKSIYRLLRHFFHFN